MGVAVAYITLMVIVPFGNVFYQVRVTTKCLPPPMMTANPSRGPATRHTLLRLLLTRLPLCTCPAPAQAFHKGFAVFFEHLLDPDFLHAIKLTLMLAAVAVPINVVFGLVAAINITRNEFPGKVGEEAAGGLRVGRQREVSELKTHSGWGVGVEWVSGGAF